MLLNSYYYNVNYFVRSLMCLVNNRKIIYLFIYYKLLAIVHVSEITWQTVYVTIHLRIVLEFLPVVFLVHVLLV